MALLAWFCCSFNDKFSNWEGGGMISPESFSHFPESFCFFYLYIFIQNYNSETVAAVQYSTVKSEVKSGKWNLPTGSSCWHQLLLDGKFSHEAFTGCFYERSFYRVVFYADLSRRLRSYIPAWSGLQYFWGTAGSMDHQHVFRQAGLSWQVFSTVTSLFWQRGHGGKSQVTWCLSRQHITHDVGSLCISPKWLLTFFFL